MAPEPGEELEIRWRALDAAGRVCDGEARRLTGPIRRFESDAYATRAAFALIQDGADELFAHYRSFYEETCGFLRDLRSDLDEAATRLHATGRIYRDAEHTGLGE